MHNENRTRLVNGSTEKDGDAGGANNIPDEELVALHMGT